MGVAQKNHVLHLGSLIYIPKFFGISGAPMEHNTTAKSKKTFLLLKCINGPGLNINIIEDNNIALLLSNSYPFLKALNALIRGTFKVKR